MVAPRADNVEVLELRRGGQNDVRITRGVRQEMLDDDGEQVLTREPGAHASAVLLHDGGVRPEHHEPLDGRRERRAREVVTKAREIESPGLARKEIRAGCAPLMKHRTRLDEQPAAGMTPVAAE